MYICAIHFAYPWTSTGGFRPPQQPSHVAHVVHFARAPRGGLAGARGTGADGGAQRRETPSPGRWVDGSMSGDGLTGVHMDLLYSMDFNGFYGLDVG